MLFARRHAALGALLLAACVEPGKAPGGGGTRDDTDGVDTSGETAPDTDTDTDTAADSGDSTPGDTAAPDPAPPPCDAWAAPRDVGTVAEVTLDEVSGVAASTANPGVLWVHVDHGGAAAFYALDYTGAALGAVTLDGVVNDDWEAMALGPCAGGEGACLWAADVGDNALDRTEVVLYSIPEPTVGWAGGLDATVVATRYPLVYADGPRNVEAFFLSEDGLPVFLTKRGDGFAEVFVVDTLTPGVTVNPRKLAEIPTRPADAESGGVVTSADLWPDGTRALVRTYDRVWELDLGEAGLDGLAAAPEIALPFADVDHVEAVAYDGTLRGYWQIAEGPSPAITFTACLD